MCVLFLLALRRERDELQHYVTELQSERESLSGRLRQAEAAVAAAESHKSHEGLCSGLCLGLLFFLFCSF